MPRALTFHLTSGAPSEVCRELVEGGFDRAVEAEGPWHYPTSREPQLFLWLSGDYSWIRRDLPEEYVEILEQLHGVEPVLLLHVEVSGRIPGDDQVRFLARLILGKFEGCAVDEYSPHGWTLAEIEADTQVGGLRFFDYRAGAGGGR